MLGLIISRSGYGKTTLIIDRIKNLVNEQKEVVLIIPEQISFETEKEVLNTVGPEKLKYVSVMSFTRLCSRFFDEYGGREKPYIDSIGKTALMEEALKKVLPALSLFRKSALTPQFCKMMIDFSANAKKNTVSVEKLNLQAQKSTGILKQKLFETSVILSEYENMLNKDYFDPLDDLSVVAQRLESSGFFNNKTVFIDSYTGFTSQQLSVIEKIIKTSVNTYIALGFDGIYSKNALSVFSNMAKCALDLKQLAKDNHVEVLDDEILVENFRHKNGELDFLEKNIFANEENFYNEECNNIFVTSAKNIYEEAEYVAKTILKSVRTSDLRFRDIAIISRDASEYNGIIDDVFEKYNIPLFIDDREGVENLSIFKLVSFALSAINSKFDRDSVISLLKTGIIGISEDDASLFELYCIVWKINKSEFFDEFTLPVDSFLSGTEEDQLIALKNIEKTRQAIVNPLLKFKKNSGKTVKSTVTAVYELIKDYKCAKFLKQKADTLFEKGYTRLSESTVRSYDIMIHVLDQIYISLNDAAMDLKHFSDVFSSAVSLLDMGSLPQGLDAVAVGSAERMRPKSPKVTFVIGANEGVFPSSKSGNGLFSDNELAKLKSAGINLPFYDIDTAVDEQYLAYCALCSPSQSLYVSYSTASLAMEEKEPSVIVENLLKIFPMLKVVKYDDTEIAAAEDALKAYALSHGKRGEIKRFFSEHPNKKFSSIENAMHKNVDFISVETAKKLYGSRIYTSASKLETFSKCRFYYFCKYGIKANPIKEASVDNLSRGSLIHFVLEGFINKYTVSDFFKLEKSEIVSETFKFGEEYFKKNISAKKQTQVEEYRFKKLCETAVELVIRVYSELKQSEFIPVHTELSIGGEKPDIPPYEVDFEDGKIILTGFIDRVDIAEKNQKRIIRIIDYKTGTKKLNLSDMYYGQNIQMPLYMKAVLGNGKQKFGECIPGGMFYLPAKDAAVNAAKSEDEAVIEEERLKKLRLEGMFLGEEDTYTALEPEGKSIYTPVKLNKDGTLSSSAPFYTKEQFDILSEYIDLKLKSTAKAITSGDITASPTDGVGVSACDYCDYANVCKFKGEHNKVPKLKNDEVFKIMYDEINEEKEGSEQ